MSDLPKPTQQDPRQVAYAAFRHAWRKGLERWIAAGRPANMAVWEP